MRLEALSVEEIIDEMVGLSKSGDMSVLINHACMLDSRVNELDENYIKSLILNEEVPEIVRVTMLQISEKIADSDSMNWDELYLHILEDKNENVALKNNAVWALSASERTEAALEYIIRDDSETGEVAFQSLKRLDVDNPERALSLAENILSEHKIADVHRLKQAIKVISNSLEKGSKVVDSSAFVATCEGILNASDDATLNDTILYALKDVGSAEAVEVLLSHEKVDDMFKCVNLYEGTYEASISPSAISGTKLGYAVFRDGAGINPSWHAGLMVEESSAITNCIVHITDLDSGVIEDSLTNFKNGQEFKGIYRPKNGFTNAKRTLVADKARELVTEEINYTLLQQVKYSSMGIDVTTKAEPNLITHIRCDGVTEYCYEYYDMRVFGGVANWNIAINNTANVNAHYGNAVNPETQATTYLTLVNREEP